MTGCIPLGMQCFLCGCRARQCGAAPALLSDRGRPCCSVQCPVQRCMCTMIAAAAALAPVARLPSHPAKTTLCHPLHTPAADHARFEAQLDHFELKQEAVVQKVGQRMDWSGWQRLRPKCLRPPTRPPVSCFQPIALSLASSSGLSTHRPAACAPAPCAAAGEGPAGSRCLTAGRRSCGSGGSQGGCEEAGRSGERA